MIEITPLILTYNEASNISRTVTALVWAAEILIVDSFSSDNTIALACSVHPNVRVVQRAFDTFAGQCNFGLSEVRTPWVLSLDADYVLTAELCAEIMSLAPPDGAAGYRAEFSYCVSGRRLRTTLYPPRTVLYRRELAAYREDGHGHRVQIDGTVQALQGCIDHDDRKPLTRWLHAQDRYMIIEARHLLATPPEALSRQDQLRQRIYYAPVVMFIYLLLVRRLILDGWPGLFYVFQRTLAEILLSLRMLSEREKL